MKVGFVVGWIPVSDQLKVKIVVSFLIYEFSEVFVRSDLFVVSEGTVVVLDLLLFVLYQMAVIVVVVEV